MRVKYSVYGFGFRLYDGFNSYKIYDFIKDNFSCCRRFSKEGLYEKLCDLEKELTLENLDDDSIFWNKLSKLFDNDVAFVVADMINQIYDFHNFQGYHINNNKDEDMELIVFQPNFPWKIAQNEYEFKNEYDFMEYCKMFTKLFGLSEEEIGYFCFTMDEKTK